MQQIEPRGVSWLEILADLAQEASDASCDAGDRFVRKLFYALSVAGPEVQEFLPITLSEEELETLLDHGACDSAFFRMVGSHLNWIVSRNSEGISYATVGIPDLVDECSRRANAISIALVGATAAAVITAITELHSVDQASSANLH